MSQPHGLRVAPRFAALAARRHDARDRRLRRVHGLRNVRGAAGRNPRAREVTPARAGRRLPPET